MKFGIFLSTNKLGFFGSIESSNVYRLESVKTENEMKCEVPGMKVQSSIPGIGIIGAQDNHTIVAVYLSI